MLRIERDQVRAMMLALTSDEWLGRVGGRGGVVSGDSQR